MWYERTFNILAIIGILANFSDMLTTFYAINFLNSYEANPVMAFLFSYPLIGYPLKAIIGTWIFLPFKYCPRYFILYCSKEGTLAKKILQVMIILVMLFMIYIFFSVSLNNLGYNITLYYPNY